MTSGFSGDSAEVDHSELVGAVDSKMFEEVFSPPARGMDQDMGLFGHSAFDLDLDWTDRVDDPLSQESLAKCAATNPAGGSEFVARANQPDLLQFNGLLSADLLEGISATSREELLAMFETSVKSFQAVSCPSSPWHTNSHASDSRAPLFRSSGTVRRVLPLARSDTAPRGTSGTCRRPFSSSSCPGSPVGPEERKRSRAVRVRSSVPAGCSLLKPSVVSAIREKAAAAAAVRALSQRQERGAGGAVRQRRARAAMGESRARRNRAARDELTAIKRSRLVAPSVDIDTMSALESTVHLSTPFSDIPAFSSHSERVNTCSPFSAANTAVLNAEFVTDTANPPSLNPAILPTCADDNMFLSTVDGVTDVSTLLIDEVSDVFPPFVDEIDCLTANELSSLTFDSQPIPVDSVNSESCDLPAETVRDSVETGSVSVGLVLAPSDDCLAPAERPPSAVQDTSHVNAVPELADVPREEEIGAALQSSSTDPPGSNKVRDVAAREVSQSSIVDCSSSQTTKEERTSVVEVTSVTSTDTDPSTQEAPAEATQNVPDSDSGNLPAVSPQQSSSPSSSLGNADTFTSLIEQLQQRLRRTSCSRERALIESELSRVSSRLELLRRHARRLTRRIGRCKTACAGQRERGQPKEEAQTAEKIEQCDGRVNNVMVSDTDAIDNKSQKLCSEGVMAEHSYSSMKTSECAPDLPATDTIVAEATPSVELLPSNPAVKRKISLTEYKKRSRNTAAQTPVGETNSEPLTTGSLPLVPPTADNPTNQSSPAVTESAQLQLSSAPPKLSSASSQLSTASPQLNSAHFEVPVESATIASFCDPTAVFEQLEAGNMSEFLESIMCASPTRSGPGDSTECAASAKLDGADSDCTIVNTGDAGPLASCTDSGVSVCGSSVCSGSSVVSGGCVDSSVSVCDSISSGSPCSSDVFVCQQSNRRGRERERRGTAGTHSRSRSPCYRRSRSTSCRRRRNSRSTSHHRRRRSRSSSSRERRRACAVERQHRQQQREAVQRRVVYVNGLSADVTHDQLHAMFQRHGHITRIKIKQRSGNASNVYGEKSPRCYAFVTFASQRSAVEAQHQVSKEFPLLEVRFGGRRDFCLDQNTETDGADNYGTTNHPKEIDFDTLLQMEMERVQRSRNS